MLQTNEILFYKIMRTFSYLSSPPAYQTFLKIHVYLRVPQFLNVLPFFQRGKTSISLIMNIHSNPCDFIFLSSVPFFYVACVLLNIGNLFI